MDSTTDPKPLLDKLNNWFKKHIKWVLCILILSWTGVRIYYYNSIIKSPLYSLYLFDQSDNKFFDDWAKYLNKDWLNTQPLHPYHWWHKSFANYYLKKNPEKLKEILAEKTNKDSSTIVGLDAWNFAEKALWNEWYHGNQYHQEPLYPYLLAVFYYLNIDEVNAMIIIQLMLGILSGILLFFITRKYFGETTAVLTGVLYLLCGILLYNEIILLRTSWIVFLTILNVVVIDRVFSRPKPLLFFLCGLCIGVSFLMQSTFTLFLIGVLVITFFTGRQNLVQYLKNSGLLLLGFFILFSPVIIRNMIVGAPTFSTSSVGPVTFIACNAYGTDTISAWYPSAETDAEIMGKANKSLSKAIIATLKTYPSIGPYFSLEWNKLKAAWGGIEFPNNENYYFYKQHIPILQYTWVNFFLLAPLALSGLIFCIYYRKKYYALYLAIAVQLITLLLFYVLARLRAPLVILALPLAAFTIIECFNIQHKKKSIVFAELGLAGILLFLSFSDYSPTLDTEMITAGNYELVYATYFANKLSEYSTKQQWDKWLELQKQLIDLEPDYVSHIKTDEDLINVNQVYIVQDFEKWHQLRKGVYDILGDSSNAVAENTIVDTLNSFIINYLKGVIISGNLDKSARDAYCNRGIFYVNAGKIDLAIADFDRAIELDSTDADAYNNRALLYLNESKLDLALSDLNEAIAHDSTFALYYYNRGIVYNRLNNKINLSIADFSKAIKLEPNYAAAYNDRGLCYIGIGKTNLALADFTESISIDSNNASAYSDRAFLYVGQGKNDLALIDCNKAIAHNPTSPLYLYNRALFYKGIKQYEKAIEDFTRGIELMPQNVEVYFYNRGICFASIQNYSEAIDDFSKAIQLNQSVPDYWLSRSLAESQTGQIEMAEADAFKAKQLQKK